MEATPDTLFHGFRSLVSEFGGHCAGHEDIAKMVAQRVDVELPPLVRHYLENLLPERPVDLFDNITLCGGYHFLTENFDTSPAMYLLSLGFWTIGTGACGDALMIVAHECEALWISPERFHGRGESDALMTGLQEENGDLLPDQKPTRELIFQAFPNRFTSLVQALHSY